MKYCSKCGKEIEDDAVICIHCGRAVNDGTVSRSADADAPNTGFAVLGFLIPLVGLILYLVYKDTQPLKAKSAGKGALIGVCASVVLSIIYGVFVGSLIAGMM